MKERLIQIKDRVLAELSQVADLEALEKIEIKYLGRKGELSLLLRGLREVSQDERPLIGKLANEVRSQVVSAIAAARQRLDSGPAAKLSLLDITWPGRAKELGHLHPLTVFQRRIEDIFLSMGFEVLDGPEVETPKYNFDLLNIPKDHPARDAWDTFYVEKNLLLRTHTSPMQLRAMESRKPPVRLLIPGRTFRHEATDASHDATFYQYEGLVIDKCISAANLLTTLQQFFQTLFGQEVKIKARSSFFPFTEPSMEIAMSCLICGGTGCSVCKRTGWLEMLGAGLVQPQVLKNMKIDPEEYSGFAFGGGIDRLMMLYHGINDIRLSYGGDLRFLEQF
jgi:phenylalanyl-tRNA synthetase alpha chain